MANGLHRSAAAREVDGLDAVAALRHGRRLARLSQRDLARRATVSQSLIARIEARRVDPPVGLLQRLLGFCGLRWELRLTTCGATPGRAAACELAGRKSARRRADSADGARRVRENAAAREAAERLSRSPITARERRSEVRATRRAERAKQQAQHEQLIASDDQAIRAWLAADRQASNRLLARRLARLRVPLADRLPVQLAGPAPDALRALLEELSHDWPYPKVALTGSSARAVWSPGRVRPSSIDLHLAPLRGRGTAASLTRMGATPLPEPDRFDWRGLTLRLWPAPAPSVVLVRWRPDRPERALPVARAEAGPAAIGDRHAIRAVLESADRDDRGRRHPPYHEELRFAARPFWFEPGR